MNTPAPSRTQQLEALRRSPELQTFVERAQTGNFGLKEVSAMYAEARRVIDIEKPDFVKLVRELADQRRVQPPRLHTGEPYQLGDVYAPQTQATATLADPDYIADQYRFDPARGDLFLGRCPRSGTPLGVELKEHAIMFATTGAGKGTGVIIPNHCYWPGSLLSIDPKGENATITASRRGWGSPTAKGLGQKVVILDPFLIPELDGEVGEKYRGRFNPLEELDPNDPKCLAKARKIAQAIVVRTGHESEEYWKDEPTAILEVVILHVITHPFYAKKRDLVTVRELVSGGEELAAAAFAKKHGEDEPRDPTRTLLEMIKRNGAFNGKLRRKATKLLRMYKDADRQWVGVDSGVDVQTLWLDDPLMQDVVRGPSTFKLSEFKDLPHGLSVYVCLPSDRTEDYFRWQRVVLTMVAEEHRATRGDGVKGIPTLFSLDEFAILEKLKSFQTGISNFRGHGIRLLTVLQDINQLKDLYKDAWPTFLGNSPIKIFFGMDNLETMEYAQKLVGDVELVRDAMSQGVNAGSNYGVQLSRGQGVTAGIGVTASQADGNSRAISNTHADTYSQAQTTGQNRSVAKGSSTAKTITLAEAMSQSRTSGSGRTSTVGSNRSDGVSQNQGEGVSYDDPGWGFRNMSKGNGFLNWAVRDNAKMSQNSSVGTQSSVGVHQSNGYTTNQADTHGRTFTKSDGLTNSQSHTDTQGVSASQTASQGGSDTHGLTDTATRTDTQGTSANLSAQRSQNAGVQAGMSEQRSAGMQEVFQTRPFFLINELREYFAKLDNKRHPAYPGLALIFLPGEAPAVVRRVNYYED